MIAISGALKDETSRRGIPRLLLGDKASLKRTSRHWLPVDIDGELVKGETVEERLHTLWTERLPEPLRGVTCWYQFTSSYGVHGELDDMRVRLWFWLDAPLANDVARQWMKHAGCHIDPAILGPVQPIYIAPPRFAGMEDPVPARCGFLRSAATCVVTAGVEAIATATATAERLAKAGAVVQRADVEPCQAQIEHRIDIIRSQSSGSARHDHAMGAVCELYGLGADPALICEVADDVIRRQGRDPRPREIEDMLAFAARKDSVGQLKTEHTPLSRVLTDEWEKQAADAPPPALEDIEEMAVHPLKGGELTSQNPDALNAQIYLRGQHVDGGFMRWAEQDWEWIGKCWRRLENKETLKQRVDQFGGVALSEAKARSCVSKIRGLCGKERLQLPGWITKEVEASPAVVLNNGMLFIEDALIDPKTALVPHNMDYFTTHAMPFDYAPDAKCPTWERCVGEWFLNDPETAREFQKMFGYLLIPDNRFEKFFVMTDANGRAGKGTAVRVLEWLLGDDAIGATSFSGFAKDFGLGALAGKSVALFNEANAQNQADVPIQAVDRIKMITGNDKVEVERKGVDSVHMRLKLRLVMSCNRMPNFRDPSGALMKRMVLLEFKQTFFGREDATLKQTDGPLYAELAGIFNWAMRGLGMLLFDDKRFIRPKSSQETFDQAERIAAPVKAFASDCLISCGVEAGYTNKDQMYAIYCAWAIDKEGQQRAMSREKFFAEIRLIFPHRIEARLSDRRSGNGPSRVRVIHGLLLNEEAQALVRSAQFDDAT